MRILIATSEAIPYVKTGGLADVAGSLSKIFSQRNEKASLILPLYAGIKKKFTLCNTGREIKVPTGDRVFTGRIWTSEKSSCPESYFIECDEFYDRDEIYGTSQGDYPDNAARFIFFSRAVLETCMEMNITPDILHCNDWQTALIPLYLRTIYSSDKHFRKTVSFFTVHNLGYQGIFNATEIVHTGLGWGYYTPESLEFYGRLCFLKAGLLYADKITTVSKTYAKEILVPENSFGMDGVLSKRQDDLSGIINGIDYKEWDPSKDILIPEKYSIKNPGGKRKCKEYLARDAGFSDKNAPVLGIVSRLSYQKGLDLIFQAMEELMNMGVNIVILGKGEEYYHTLFANAAKKYKGRLFFRPGFEESLAHRIYAGSDFFLMPSRYEPCGLGQLIAMRYGTIPVARKTGGLADTVMDYNHMLSEGTGFLFSDFTPAALLNAVKRAICVFLDEKKMKKMLSDAMQADFSWEISAGQYLELYRKAVRKNLP